MITELVGPAGIGKTQTCLMMAAQVTDLRQRAFLLAVFLLDLAYNLPTPLDCSGLSSGQSLLSLKLSPIIHQGNLKVPVEGSFSLSVPTRTTSRRTMVVRWVGESTCPKLPVISCALVSDVLLLQARRNSLLTTHLPGCRCWCPGLPACKRGRPRRRRGSCIFGY